MFQFHKFCLKLHDSVYGLELMESMASTKNGKPEPKVFKRAPNDGKDK